MRQCMECKYSHNKYGNYCYKFHFKISNQHIANKCKCYKYGYKKDTQLDPVLESWFKKVKEYQEQKAKENQGVG